MAIVTFVHFHLASSAQSRSRFASHSLMRTGICSISRIRNNLLPRSPTKTRELVTSQLDNDRFEAQQNVPPETTLIPELEALDPQSGAVIIRPTFYLASFFLFSGGLLCYAGEGFLIPGLPLVLVGLLLTVQTVRVRFIFGPRRLSVVQRSLGGEMSILRGWEFEKITNWEVWWKRVGVLAYFKESESYNGRGSIHFFPILCDSRELTEQLRKRTPHLDKSSYDD